ncbi:MAG: hypothetical protein KDH94_08645, partial [Coxiellaceae bacterium]|nr:hypothetical protein [Coxiellaceae bacterium]
MKKAMYEVRPTLKPAFLGFMTPKLSEEMQQACDSLTLKNPKEDCLTLKILLAPARNNADARVLQRFVSSIIHCDELANAFNISALDVKTHELLCISADRSIEYTMPFSFADANDQLYVAFFCRYLSAFIDLQHQQLVTDTVAKLSI